MPRNVNTIEKIANTMLLKVIAAASKLILLPAINITTKNDFIISPYSVKTKVINKTTNETAKSSTSEKVNVIVIGLVIMFTWHNDNKVTVFKSG